jgi:hypothetical protein
MKNELLAPNGKPSNLNATQYELVRTSAFKKWFGDWEYLANFDSYSLEIANTKDYVNSILKDDNLPKKIKPNSVIYHKNNYDYIICSDENGKINGALTIYPNGKIDQFAISEKMRGKGIGKKMIDLAIDNGATSVATYTKFSKTLIKYFLEKTVSKAVDDNGEPLVVYRGNLKSQSELGYKYNLGYNFLNKSNSNNFGFFFTNQVDVAKKYMDVDVWGDILGGSLTEVFLKVNKILNLTELGLYCSEFDLIEFLDSKNISFKGYENLKENILNFDYSLYDGFSSNIYDYFDIFPELRNVFKSNGFSGVYFYEKSRSYFQYKTYVVFESNQIKLADGTNSLFDANSDDIRFAKGGEAKGDCYSVAGQIAMEINSKKIDYKGTPYLVHAEVKHSAIDGLRFGHAFIEDDVNVYDFSNNREIIIPKELYYYFGDINPKDKKKYRKYTFREATKKMNDTGNYGCWDLDVEYNKGGSLEDKNTLKAKKIADEAQDKISFLECDGATRVLHYLFQEQNVKHVVKRGSVVFGKDDIPLHYWIELPDGSVVDYKSRMWLGKNAQQGVFNPNEKIEYLGRETDLKVSKFIYETLTMSTGGVIEKKIPDYLKMFLDL